MREVKFRAWVEHEDKISGKNNYAYMNENPEFHGSINEIFATSGKEPLNPYGCKITYMQYTGLKDNNGREIFEGDILRLNFINESYISEVLWHGDNKVIPSPEFDINWERVYTGFLESNFLSEVLSDERWSIEIIGNTYEHPHLFEDDLR